MNQKTKDIQKRYDGFLQTACLWNERAFANHFFLQIFFVSEKIALKTIW